MAVILDNLELDEDLKKLKQVRSSYKYYLKVNYILIRAVCEYVADSIGMLNIMAGMLGSAYV